jgi:hypothetical protein
MLRDRLEPFADLSRVFIDEMPDEQGNIIAPHPQGGMEMGKTLSR